MTAVIGAHRQGSHPIEARAHEAQIMAWRNCALEVNALEFDPRSFPDMHEKLTMAGIPLKVDPSLSLSCIEFRDASGAVVARIENLAIPFAFTPADPRSQPAQTTRALPSQDAPPESLG